MKARIAESGCFFLRTDDSYAEMRERGVRFLEEARTEPYGTVAVFADMCGNRWDLLEPRADRLGP